MTNLEPITALLKADATIFYSDYGSKAVEESWTKRLNKKITSADQIKEYQNINIITGGESLIVDVDLDCPESNKLADYFLAPTNMEFGRVSTPRAHRLYKVIDLTKKHTRSYFDFKGDTKSMLVEIRANKHYTMCNGQYDNGEKVVWTKFENPTEITWDTLFKSNALLSVASVLLRKVPEAGLKMRNEFWKLAIAVLWYHKVTEEDCINIVTAVTTVHDDNVNERLARVTDIYKRDKSEQLLGLPTLIKEFNWTDNEAKDFKKLLLKITGRHLLPEYTNTFIDRIAYMMKQKKYYDLEDKEMYDAEAIDVKYSKHFDGKYTPLKYWKQHKDSKVCVDFTYKPGDKNRFVHVDKKLMINVYEKNDITPNPKADTDIFWTLLKHVMPHDDCREHFLDWLAFHYQHPGKKIRWGVIMQSDEFQLGKGSLFDLHRDILGLNNTRKIELAEALDKGKNYLLNYQTVLIDEAKSSGTWSEKSQLINTLKTIITEGSIGVRQLYKEYSEQDTCTNYWLNTNYKDAFPLPKNEVRYFVYFSPAKRNQQMLDEFHNQRLNGDLASGVLAELLDRDLSKFNPLAPAPWTSFRDEMSGMADRPLNDFVREQFEQGVFPFDRDMLTTVELFDYLKKEKRLKVSREREVANALELIGGKCRKQIDIPTVGTRATVWIIRDHDHYVHMKSGDLGVEYKPFWHDSKIQLNEAVNVKTGQQKSKKAK